VKFDPEGEGYDYESAVRAGMGRGADGHMGSVAEIGPDKYLVLKGRNHSTFDKADAAEQLRGFTIVKDAGRYYAVPSSLVPGGSAMRYLQEVVE
jgi:sarcosine oxidase gamma subunit